MSSTTLEAVRRPSLPARLVTRSRTLLAPAGWALLLLLVFVLWPHVSGDFGFDFKGTLWQPARDILAGRSPYPAPTIGAIDDGNPSVYPAPVLIAATPLGLLPFPVASAVWAFLLGVSLIGTLRLLGVRDYRCYGLVLLSYPALAGLVFGNLTILLVLGLALAWRFRDRLWVVAVAVAALVVAKVFLWPLLIWLLATRRFRAAFAAAVGAALALVLGWAAIGFAGLRTYPKLLSLVSDYYGPHTWSLFSGGVGLGLSSAAAERAALAVGLALLAVAVLLASRPDGDRRAFTAATVAALALSPMVWTYYFTLLFVPIAVAKPRFGRLWALVPAFWVPALIHHPAATCCRPPGMPADVWKTLYSPPPTAQTIGYTLVLVVALVACLRARRGLSRASAPDQPMLVSPT